jgi:hypothetical protein
VLILRPEQIQRMRAEGTHARCYFGGKSKSSNATSNIDARVVGGEGSINQSQTVTGSGNTISTTDHGAVSGSLALALKGVEQAGELARETQAATGSLLSGALEMVGEQQQQHSQALENIKGNDVRTLVIAGLAVVGIAAATLLRKG